MTKAGYDYMYNHMCGTGAFSLQSFKPDTNFILARHDGYWKEPALLSKVIIKQVPDANTRLLMLQKGEADVAAIPRTLRDSVISDRSIDVIEGKASFNIDFIGLNQNINFNLTAAPKTNVPSDFFVTKTLSGLLTL